MKFSVESGFLFISGLTTVTTALDDDKYESSPKDVSPMFHLIKADCTTVESSVYSKETVTPSDSVDANTPSVGPVAPADAVPITVSSVPSPSVQVIVELYATSSVALVVGAVTGTGATKRASAVSSRALGLALPLSAICPATMIRTIAAVRPIAMFLRSVVRSPKAVLSFSVCMCMAATMLLPTPCSHLEHFGTLPIGREISK